MTTTKYTRPVGETGRLAILKEIRKEAPEWVTVLPWGEVSLVDEREPIIVDDAAAAAIREDFAALPNPLMFDYEHQHRGGEHAAPDGTAIAAGWVDQLKVEPGVGVQLHVNWTAKARKHIEEGEYRFVSPIVGYDRMRRALYIDHPGLTNTPAIAGAPALLKKQPSTTKESVMNELLKELGLKDGATEAEGIAAAKTLKADAAGRTALRIAVCKEVGLDPATTEKDDAVIEKVKSLKTAPAAPEGDKTLEAECKRLGTELATLKADRLEEKTAEFIQRGEAAGKIDATLKGMWERDYRASPEKAEAALKAARVIAPPNGTMTRPMSAGGGGGGTARKQIDELVAKKMQGNDKLARHDAFTAVCKEQPELRQQMIQEDNAK